MLIQWFPGHMTKALRMMDKEISACDVIIYVLDSRAPFSCINPKFTKLIGEKPIIYVLNKADMVGREQLLEWKEYFTSPTTECLILNSTVSNSAEKILGLIKKLSAKKVEKFGRKGINLILRAMVLGVPNSGKSTLVNNLCGKYKATTGNKPGVTKDKQWARVSKDMEILDTPGTLWPAFDNATVAKHLAYIGSIKEEVLNVFDLACAILDDIVAMDKTLLENRYNIVVEGSDTSLVLLEKLARARGFLLKGGELDIERGAINLYYEFKTGKIGKILLERVKDIPKLTKKDRKIDG